MQRFLPADMLGHEYHWGEGAKRLFFIMIEDIYLQGGKQRSSIHRFLVAREKNMVSRMYRQTMESI